ncbi:MAG: mannose-1-phosphate guanylyltransferase/mannose-6-phosphate isomerase, partial [Gammaproteobacteria bacterium]|nr:mannose-1-phosphate guanylyltransferase/mannose-6-phosphate isomerase [Gammaproteobacteria bacterium]
GDSYSGLWPLSRQASPKPFMKLGGSTLLQKAIERGQACGATDLLIVTNGDHQFLTKDVLAQMSGPPSTTMLLEPKDPTRASAIALAALQCARQFSPDTTMLILSADHLVPDVDGFVASAGEAFKLAEQGKIAVFGVSPTSPDTGIGYVEVENVSRESQLAKRFVGMPNLATAQEYLASGRYYWNSGMSCFTAGTMIAALEKHAPDVLMAAQRALDSSAIQSDSIKFDPHDLALQPDISIDDAVMSRADNVHVVPARFSWSDARAWPTVTAAHTSDSNGNTMPPEVIAIDTTGTYVQVESHGPKIVATLGIRDLVVVDTPDALLVAHKESAHDMHKIVSALKERKHDAIGLPAVVHRPWGTYASLKEEAGYKVKRITVKPGQSLSLQYHHQRAEHWVVVRGTAMVQVGDVEYKTLPGEYRYIPLKERHRLTNVGQDELVLVEVQCGAYLGEDDIVRLADTYGRA